VTRIPAIAALVAALLAVTGCQPAAAPATVSVHVGTTTVGAYRESGTKVSVSGTAAGQSVGSSFTFHGIPAVRFLGFDHPDSGTHVLYAYGVAPVGTTQVVFEPAAAGAMVAPDGTFVALISSPHELSPFVVHWRFLSGTGVVIVEGTGVTLSD
jgi:hypothetical protein